MSISAGAWEIGKEMMAAIHRLIVILMVLTFVLVPIGCYIHREIDFSDVKAKLVSELLVKCVEDFGFDESKLGKCFSIGSDELCFKIEVSDNKKLYGCGSGAYKNFKDKKVPAEAAYRLFKENSNSGYEGYKEREFSKVINKSLFSFDIIFKF